MQLLLKSLQQAGSILHSLCALLAHALQHSVPHRACEGSILVQASKRLKVAGCFGVLGASLCSLCAELGNSWASPPASSLQC